MQTPLERKWTRSSGSPKTWATTLETRTQPTCSKHAQNNSKLNHQELKDENATQTITINHGIESGILLNSKGKTEIAISIVVFFTLCVLNGWELKYFNLDLITNHLGFSISIQNCSIVAAEDLYNMNNSSSSKIKSYLWRPWMVYAQTVYIESYIDEFNDPIGWMEWPSSDPQGGLDSLYYGEYENSGPGSGTENRVSWAGYHVMDYYDASIFTVSEFITGDEWLDSTSFPYDDGL
ncbi:hypothetical protein HYC85_011395 [Camellia sinensis]|uniref:Pectinesterase catalytic domain-containing protein n=1 Tax=Camellia sinensis TaxID=4442 RepID=A0A7J7H8X2_CAMSI|nr:hypothetical protein HYC85_011395 [Camellia sinensis]